jgi:predicted nucleotidyltransferase component of viral defense system
MDNGPKNIAASVKARLLSMARKQNRDLSTLLVRFALERLLFRLSKSAYASNYVLKGGMLITQWLDHHYRETRDIDFLSFGASDIDTIKTIFTEIMMLQADDGLTYDPLALIATNIRDHMEYGGIRLKTNAFLEKTRIPITLDIAFGDALASPAQSYEYPSLLEMERPLIRAYPPAQVIAEKFQAIVSLGIANGRMKDFYDLWAIPKAIPLEAQELDDAIAATFERRITLIPNNPPVGLSSSMANDQAARRRWRAYMESLELPVPNFTEVIDEVWALVEPSCKRLLAR